MALIFSTCPVCSKKQQVDEALEQVTCALCGHQYSVGQPGAANQEEEAAPAAASAPSVEEVYTFPPGQIKLNEAYSLLETDIDSPIYDSNIKKAEGKFLGILKEDNSNYLAWAGMFGCLLKQCKKTFLKQEKIPETDYWLKAGTRPADELFQVDGYFCYVIIDEQGKFRSFSYDSILQPGRKAKYYLENSIQRAPEEEKENMQKLLDRYFTNAPKEMAQKGLEYQIYRRAQENKTPPPKKGLFGKK